jgi:spore maturation protein CgeB
VSSAWGNGHATVWRSLIRALNDTGHEVVFFEHDTPYYRAHRDISSLDKNSTLVIYPTWAEVRERARRELADADAAIVTSYCPDGRTASELVLDSKATRVFYDLDTPVTLARLAAGDDVPYLPVRDLVDFDLVLSFTGGVALADLRTRLGARRVAPLYGSVDPDVHKPSAPRADWTGACSYLGTWSHDRRAALEALFFEPARTRNTERFVLAGSMYPEDAAWPSNITCIDHVPPADHPAFYSSCPVTVNVTRAPMVKLGFCPSGRLFEAAACGVPVLSDYWPGIEAFFKPGEEIVIANSTDEAVEAIAMPRAELAAIARRARERTLAHHSGKQRAAELVALLGATS